LRKTYVHADVEVGVIRLVELRYVAVDDSHWYLAVGNEAYEVFRYQCVGVYFANVDATAYLVVEVLHAPEVLAVFFNVYLAPDKLCHVLDYRAPLLFGLHKHLGGVVLRAAWQHVLLVVLGDGYFVCYEVDQPGIEHGDSRRHAVCNLEVKHHAFLAGEAVDERVVVAHRFVAVDEV